MLALADHEISRFPGKERPHMPVSTTTPGLLGARTIAPIRVAFRQRNDVGTQPGALRFDPDSAERVFWGDN